MQEFELIAKTFQGLEEVLATELTELGANNIEIGHRMVSFTGDKELMYRANFCLRTCVRVLKPIKRFTARSADEVYDAVKSIEWADLLDLNMAFSVDAVVYSQEFRHSKFVAYKVKDAIVDYFRERTGRRPNVRLTSPDLRLNIHIADDHCTLSLDSSGESLHLRGYRVATVEAPINEVLAAGLLKIAGWDGSSNFVDPFCGSGTLLIEAALMAKNIYPGVFRKEFGFERWKDFDAALLDRIYNDDSAERTYEGKIYGYDLNRPAVEAAMSNAKAAGVGDIVVIEQRDLRHFTTPEGADFMVTNPPYGERLTPPDVLSLYQTLGKKLKHEFKGGTAWVISSKEECFEQIGLRPSVKHQILNGSLDCNFNKYQIFDGRLADFRAEGGDVKTAQELALMSDQRRFRKNRDDFKRRFEEEEEAAPRSERFTPRRERDDFRKRGGERQRDARPRRYDSYADDDFLAENPQFLVLRRRHEELSAERKAHSPVRREENRGARRDDRPDFRREDRGSRYEERRSRPSYRHEEKEESFSRKPFGGDRPRRPFSERGRAGDGAARRGGSSFGQRRDNRPDRRFSKGKGNDHRR